MQRKIKILLLIVVSILGFGLRNYKYREVPLPGQSTDEYSNAWVGISLIKSGTPIGLSGIGGYKNQKKDYLNIDNVYSSGVHKGDQLTFNWPWMDHPPGAGLVLGGWATIKGANSFFDTNVSVIRRPLVTLGTISVALVFVLGWLMFGFKAGFISGAIYAVSPLIVYASKMGQAENFLIPIFLVSMIFLQLGLIYKNNWFFYLAGVISGIGIWFKFSGIYILLAIASIVLRRKEVLKIKYFGLGFLPFLVALLYYYIRLDVANFINVNMSNAHRVYGIGVDALGSLVREQKITHTLYLKDPWILLGWIVFLITFFKKEKDKGTVDLQLAGISYLTVYLFFGGDSFGWYTYPFFPILIMILGKMISKNINNIMLAWMFVLVGGEIFFKLGWQSVVIEKSIFWRTGMVLLGGISLIGTNKAKWLNMILFGVCLATSAYFCFQMTLGGWYKLS